MASNQTSVLYLSPFVSYLSCSLNILIALLAILGNSLVLIVFFRTTKIRNCQTNYLITSLALADLIVGCVTVPMWSYLILSNFAGFAAKAPLYLVYQAFDMFSVAASIEHLMFISLERYFAVVWPVLHHLATSTVYGIVIACIWVISIVFSGSFFQGVEITKKYSIIHSVILFGVPLAIIMFSYLSILRVTLQRSSSRKTVERELKVASTILILVVLFVITWCPFFVVTLVINHCRTCVTVNTVIFLKCLHFTNSLCNPIVYAARVPDFRIAFGKVLPKKLLLFFTCRPRTMSIRTESQTTTSRGRTASNATVHTSSIVETAESRRRGIAITPPRDSVLSMSTSASPDFCASLLSSSPSPQIVQLTPLTDSQLTTV